MKKLFLSLAACLATIAHADTTTLPATQQKQIENVVHSYLVKNPEVIVESLQTLQKKQMQQAQKTMEKTQATAPKFADALFHRANDPVAGNANGKVSIVEFFDYQCPHCVDMTGIMDSIIKANPNVRVVFKEFPIRGAVSEFASRAALAANMQGKYFEFHKGLMASKAQPLTEQAILQVAQSAGLNMEKLKADMKSDAVNQQIKETYKLARDLQLMGTPALFVAKSTITNNATPTEIVFVPGQVPEAQLQEIITKVQ